MARSQPRNPAGKLQLPYIVQVCSDIRKDLRITYADSDFSILLGFYPCVIAVPLVKIYSMTRNWLIIPVEGSSHDHVRHVHEIVKRN